MAASRAARAIGSARIARGLHRKWFGRKAAPRARPEVERPSFLAKSRSAGCGQARVQGQPLLRGELPNLHQNKFRKHHASDIVERSARFEMIHELEAMLVEITGSRLSEYSEVGHSPHWEVPKRVAADVTAFVTEVVAPAETATV